MQNTSNEILAAVDGQREAENDAYSGGDHDVPLIVAYWQAVLRYKLWIGLIIALSIALSIIATLLMTPYYTATATIEINRQQERVTNVEDLQPEPTGQDLEFYQTQYSLLEARSLAQRVARALQLASDDAFFDALGINDGELNFLASDSTKTNGSAARNSRLELVTEALLERVTITPIRGSSLVDISFSSPDPGLSAKITNMWIDQFIESKLDRRFDSTADARTFLEERLAQLRERLEESERRLVLYADNKQIVTLSSAKDAAGKTITQQTLASSDLEALNSALAMATADRIAAESEAKQMTGNKNALTNIALNNIRQQRAEAAAEYAELLVQFEPEYPQAMALASKISALDASILSEERRARSGTQARFSEALQRERQLRDRVARLKNRFSDERKDSIQYNIYQREVDTNRQLYDGLLQRYKEIGVAGVGTNSISIVDRAIPPRKPSSPRLALNIALALFAGLGFAGLYVVVMEQIDQTVKDSNDLKHKLGIAPLGSVPDLENLEVLDTLLDKKSVAWEAYLSIRTSLSFLTEHGVPRSFLVTSTRPNEGKSTSAFALAAVLASAGRNVVLIDGDMRNPSLHQMMGTKNDVGLSNYLSGNDDLQSAINKPNAYGFSMITAGPIPPNAAELLSSTRMKSLVGKLGDSFDCVIVDAPPVLGLADIPLIANVVEGVIYTIEANGVKMRGIASALQRVRSSHARIFGGIVTKVASRNSGYGYGYGYDYQYTYGKREPA